MKSSGQNGDIGIGTNSPTNSRLHVVEGSHCYIKAEAQGTNFWSGLHLETDLGTWYLFHNGANYCYLDVPEETYHGLRTAESAGRFFASKVRDRFEFRRRR